MLIKKPWRRRDILWSGALKWCKNVQLEEAKSCKKRLGRTGRDRLCSELWPQSLPRGGSGAEVRTHPRETKQLCVRDTPGRKNIIVAHPHPCISLHPPCHQCHPSHDHATAWELLQGLCFEVLGGLGGGHWTAAWSVMLLTPPNGSSRWDNLASDSQFQEKKLKIRLKLNKLAGHYCSRN